MLYMTGPQDTLKELYAREGYAGTFDDYAKKFAALNPSLPKTLIGNSKLPAYMPFQLVTMPGPDSAHAATVARLVGSYSMAERQVLRNMQEESHDILTSVAVTDILTGFKAHLDQTAKGLKSPLAPTGVEPLDRSLTRKSLIKMAGEGFSHAAHLKETSSSFVNQNNLFELMKKRDQLNQEWLSLKGKKGVDAARRTLESQTKAITSQIKKLLPKHLQASGKKYILGFPTQDAAKLRSNSSSLKLAKKGVETMKATHLDRLTTTGLARQRQLIQEFKFLGAGLKQFATYTNKALVGVSIAQAVVEGKNVAKTAFQEGTSYYAGVLLSAAAGGGLAGLGGIAIGSLAGDVALGTAILVCYPVIGWVVLVVAGAVVAGAVAYQTKDAAGQLWDSVDNSYVREKVVQLGRWIYDDLKWFGEQIMKNDL